MIERVDEGINVVVTDAFHILQNHDRDTEMLLAHNIVLNMAN